MGTSTVPERTIRRISGAEAAALTPALQAGRHVRAAAGSGRHRMALTAALRDDRFVVLAAVAGDPSPTVTSGDPTLLGLEMDRLITAVEDAAGVDTADLVDEQRAAHPPTDRFDPGDLLALAEVIRIGDQRRIDAGCLELGIPAPPPWVQALAWGAAGWVCAELVDAADDAADVELAVLLQCTEHGWGRLMPDPQERIGWVPMTSADAQVQVTAVSDALLGGA